MTSLYLFVGILIFGVAAVWMLAKVSTARGSAEAERDAEKEARETEADMTSEMLKEIDVRKKLNEGTF